MTVKVVQYSKGVVLETVVKELDFTGLKYTMEQLGFEVDEVEIRCMFKGVPDDESDQ